LTKIVFGTGLARDGERSFDRSFAWLAMFAVVAQVPLNEPLRQLPYWSQSRGPLASLLFIAPLLALYEVGVIQLGPLAMRNGADLWLRYLLDSFGFEQYFLLPAVTVIALLAWHHLNGDRWRLAPRLFCGMSLESLALAITLVLLAQVQGALLRGVGIPLDGPRSAETSSSRQIEESSQPQATVTVGPARITRTSRLIAFLGAGIYEEVLFRLLLVPAAIAVFEQLGMSRTNSILWSIVLTSVLFATAHYLGPHGEQWRTFSFVFRTLAGVFFGLLFVYRGFGITAGAHAGYDILVGLD
jgi:membrane protease YdiL (CAAX protease family)